MTFTYQNPATHSFVPETWDGALITRFDPLLVWASRIASNRSYEGNITGKGDVVHVNALSSITVNDYEFNKAMAAQRPETISQPLEISEAKYIKILLENAEQAQAAGSLEAPVNTQMIRAMARQADLFMGTVIANSATALPDVTAINHGGQQTAEVLYNAILDAMLALDEKDVPNDGQRYAVVGPKVKRYLLQHPMLANAAAYGEDGVTKNGIVAKLAGFTLLTTTAMPKDVDIVAGHPDFATFAQAFSGFRMGQSEDFRADYIDSLSLYGGRIVRFPDLDTVKDDGTFDDSKPTPGIQKAKVIWKDPTPISVKATATLKS
ncbi:phage capsid protein [Streptomyces violascens]|uniref:phage capsid protein n=1 Tax=Streptomyces violascens TaxID=67381 RepID=UPI003655FB7D